MFSELLSILSISFTTLLAKLTAPILPFAKESTIAKGISFSLQKLFIFSITDDPKIIDVPEDYTFTISDIRPSFGAGFVVVMSGNIIDMPGLPKLPNANIIDINENEEIEGLS